MQWTSITKYYLKRKKQIDWRGYYKEYASTFKKVSAAKEKMTALLAVVGIDNKGVVLKTHS